MSNDTTATANPHIARMLDLIAPIDLPPAPQVVESSQPEVPRRVFATLSPFFDEARRVRQAAVTL